MKHFTSFMTSCVIAFAALPAFAQPAAGPGGPGPGYGYGYGYHHFWGGGWGWHLGLILFCALVALLALIGIVALVALAARCCRHYGHGGYYGRGGCPFCGHGGGRAALDILEERLAKGEIDKNEFEEKRKLLGR